MDKAVSGHWNRPIGITDIIHKGQVPLTETNIMSLLGSTIWASILCSFSAYVIRFPLLSAYDTADDISDTLSSLILWPKVPLGHSRDYDVEPHVPLCDYVKNVLKSIKLINVQRLQTN